MQLLTVMLMVANKLCTNSFKDREIQNSSHRKSKHSFKLTPVTLSRQTNRNFFQYFVQCKSPLIA